MDKHLLGQTGIEVSELCYGTLTIGPLQKKLSDKEGGRLLCQAHELGINFFDTADLYNTYGPIRELLKVAPESIICSRSYDYTAEGVEKSLERALRETGRDYIDLFLLHEQESRYTFEGHSEAFDALIKARESGKIRATGFSTHRIEAVRDSLDYPELEIVFPLLNRSGLGIEDGSAREMLSAIEAAHSAGKGVFIMKPLGGGNLIGSRSACLDYQKQLLKAGLIDSVAIGMGTSDEVRYNTAYFENKKIPLELAETTLKTERHLHIDDWCEKCGRCVKRCHQKALKLTDNGVEVNHKKCLRCGYCAGVCPVFAIKIV